MQEVYVQEDMFTTKKEEPPEQSATRRRQIKEDHQEQRPATQQTFDFSRVDFINNLQIRQSVARAGQRLIEIQQRRRTGGT